MPNDDTIHRVPSAWVPGIADSVRVHARDLIFISGAVGRTPDGSPPISFEHEVELCFTDLSRALVAAGASFSSVVKMNVYIVDLTPARFDVMRAVRERWLDQPPASTLVGVSALVSELFTIEIEAIAAI